VFALVSKVWFWYALIAALPMAYGVDGLTPAVQMILTGAVGVAFYKLIKTRAVRERPYITHAAIECVAAPLDRYSFPSGHTLHAVSFTLLAAHYFPALGAPLAAFALAVALSRVVLGLHYPTDVAAGALLGGLLALGSLEAGAALIG
jgi:undecaprenyl-diphosphatase